MIIRVLFALLLTLSSLMASAGSLLLINAHLVDPALKTQTIGHVLIDGDKVVDVLKEIPTNFTGETVDLTGKYLIPGLVDAHVHSEGNRDSEFGKGEDFGPEETARRMLYAGVTAYLDLGLDADSVFAARRKLRAHEIFGADLYAVGPVIIGRARTGTSGGAIGVTTPDEARAALDRLALQHPDLVKLIFDWANGKNTMSAGVMRELIAHARKLGLKTVVHIGNWENGRLAAEAGPTAITHLDDNAVIPEGVAKAMGAKHIYSIPTMAVQQDFLDILGDHRLLDRPLLREMVSEPVIASYRRLDPKADADCITCRWQREGRKYYGVSLQRLLRAGVPIVAGSDTGNLGTFQGYSLHREIEILRDWGLSNWDALASATTNAYALLGLNMGFKRGADASFVVLNASPVADVANTQTIHGVLFHGEWVDRAALRKPLP